MSRTRKATGVLIAAAVSIGLSAANAGAQNLDINELAAAVALPVITGGGSGDFIADNAAYTLITITNGKSTPVVLRIDYIDGEGSTWGSESRDCLLTGRETTTFLARPFGNNVIIYGECSTPLTFPGGNNPVNLQIPSTADNGIFFAAAATNTDQGVMSTGENVLLADAVVIDVAVGQAYSFGAISFQGGAVNDGDKVYKFDGNEYSKFPAVLATNFISPATGIGPDPERINAELILFTLDGTLGQSPAPEVFVFGDYYDDDETPGDFQHTFSCFDIVSLVDLAPGFDQFFSGSLSGHLSLRTIAVGAGGFEQHDATYGNGNNSRNRGVHGWIVQQVIKGEKFALTDQPSICNPPSGPGGQCQDLPPGAAGMAQTAAWARPLSQSTTALVPEQGAVSNPSQGADLDPVLAAGVPAPPPAP